MMQEGTGAILQARDMGEGVWDRNDLAILFGNNMFGRNPGRQIVETENSDVRVNIALFLSGLEKVPAGQD